MHRFDAANTGYTPDQGPTSEVEARWSVELDDMSFYGTPAVVGDTVYVAGHQTLFALDIETGEQRWLTDVPSPSSPGVEDGTVILGGGDGTIYGLDSATGDELWQFETDSDFFVSSPTIVDGVVYIGGTDGQLYAVNAATGAEEWTYRFDARIQATPAVVDDTVYIGDAFGGESGQRRLVALAADTGDEQWRFELSNGGLFGAPVVVDETVYLASSDVIQAIAADTGEERWTVRHDGFVDRSPAVSGNTIYVQKGRLAAYSTESGEEQWVNENVNVQETDPAVTDDTIYVTGHGGKVHALDVEDGTSRWQFEVADLPGAHGMGSGGTPPAVVGGAVYVAGVNGAVYALAEA